MAFCVACGTLLPEAARFCPSCGVAVSSRGPPAETLKLVSVLFADVVSSTARMEGMHPEDARALMVDYFTAMAEEVVAEGGSVEKFVGDAVMAVFGVPQAHEDDAVRAVRTGQRMLARLASWNEEHGLAEPFEVRIGINTGEVVTAAEPRADLLVTGAAVNVAARLQEAAAPGAIVIGEATSHLVRRAYDLRELDPVPVHGRSEPVRAWVVTGERETPAETFALSGHFVGRRRELDQLGSILDRVAVVGAPRLVTVTGEPGVGKSRLAQEFIASLGDAVTVLSGRCLAYGEGVTLRPLGEILSGEAGVLGNDPPDTALAKIETFVARTVATREGVAAGELASTLASTLWLEPDDWPGETLDPRELRHRLVSAWQLLLSEMARERPVVVFVEDLHWAGEAMLDVLDELVQRVRGPVLFLCTTRPELVQLRPGWGAGRRNFTEVELGPLGRAESERLVRALLESEPPHGVRRAILARAEGNPFFLEEIVRRLVDANILERLSDHASDEGERVELELPETIQGVILARIDLLSADERRALQEAAVVGRVFWSGAVARLTDVDDPGDLLRTLCRRELVAEHPSSSMAGESEYSFKHVLTRDVAYESLPRRERARAHVRVAAWIEDISGQRLAELREILAHHYDVAYSLSPTEELRLAARENYLAASNRALRQFALAQAGYLGRQAVRLSTNGPELVEALEALGDLSATAHTGDDAWRAYNEAIDAVGDDREALGRLSAKAAVEATRWYGGMRDHPTTEELERLIDRGLRATGAGDSVWRALLLMSRGFELIWGYTDESGPCEEAAHAALEIAERLDDPNLLAGTLDGVGSLLLARCAYGEHLRFGRRRIELVPRLTSVLEIGDAFVMGAWSALYVGLYEEAVTHTTACIERAAGVDPGGYVHGLAWRVSARAMTGDWDGALRDQAELERIQEGRAGAVPLGYTLRAYSAAAFVHELRGERDEAERYLHLVEEFDRAHPAASSLDRNTALALAARALAHCGRTDEARAVFDATSAPQAPPTLEALCELTGAAEDWDAAKEVVAAARLQADASEALALPLFADRLEARLRAFEGDLDRAVVLLRRSADGFGELGAAWEQAWSRLLLAEALIELRDPTALGQLDAARAVFERLGSVEERERASADLALT